MVGYKLSKNDWVTPFFVIFRSVREILLVTVFCKHPVQVVIMTGVGVGAEEKTLRFVHRCYSFSAERPKKSQHIGSDTGLG